MDRASNPNCSRCRLPLALIVATLLSSATQAQQTPPRFPLPVKIDANAATSAGVRQLTSRHLRLFTDLPSSEAVDQLPELFDAAVPLWAEYFQVDPRRFATWRVQGFLIKDRQKFADLGMLPPDNLNFLNGFAHDRQLWMEEQPTDYYRRHLLLHEGTHAFMLHHYGRCGPGWHMEGLAELLGTHRWDPTAPAGKRLTLGVVPVDKRAVPHWGRIKLIRDAVKTGRQLSVDQVMRISNRSPLETEQYAWSWAFTSLLENDPRFQRALHQIRKTLTNAQLTDRLFNRRLREQLPRDVRHQLSRQWQAMIATLDYGYDHQRLQLVEVPITPLADGPQQATIAADRGWQSTGWQLTAGQTYQLTAKGRYRIALDTTVQPPTPWPCEPGGITLEYHSGEPLGKLLAAVVPATNETLGQLTTSRAKAKPTGFFAPQPVGLGGTIRPTVDSVLYLRVNDHPARLADNQGQLTVTIRSDR